MERDRDPVRRLHRLHGGKREVLIYDYVDAQVPVLARMLEKRLAAYRAIDYEREGEPGGEPSLIPESGCNA